MVHVRMGIGVFSLFFFQALVCAEREVERLVLKMVLSSTET